MGNTKRMSKEFGFSIIDTKLKRPLMRTVVRNCVNPELGLHILNCISTDNVQKNLNETSINNEK